ncbi:MAG: hypothetical protein WD904_05195 [Dehalococcoidia bacterium]
MTRTSGLSLRPALVLILALVAVSTLFLASHAVTDAGTFNTLAIDPAHSDVNEGGSTSVELVSNAPAESLAAWVVEIAFDPAVVSFGSCTSIANPPGSVAATACESKDTGGSADDDTVVSVGGILFSDTERGLDGANTLATMEFDAVGDIDDCTDLTISVTSHLGPDPNGAETNPSLTHGEICIIENTGTNRLWGDVDCGGSVSPVDSLKILRKDAGLTVDQAAGCPALAVAVIVDSISRLWGDVDCGGSFTPVDSLKILRFDAGLSVDQAAGCPTIGSTVSVAD